MQLFSLSLRSLSFFRIFLGGILFIDTCIRLMSLSSFTGEGSVLPLDVLVSNPTKDWSWRWSLCFINDTLIFNGLILVALLISSLMIMLGSRTKFFLFIAWVFIVSIQIRNPYILNGGDRLLKLLIFWSLFLPLHEHYSVSAKLNLKNKLPEKSSTASLASMAYILQILCIYIFTVLYKLTYQSWLNGQAINIIFQKDQITTNLGKWVGTFPEIFLACMTPVFLVTELVLPIAMVVSGVFSWRAKTYFIFSMILMHLCFYFSFRIEMFPFINILSLIPFLPNEFWDRISARIKFISFLWNRFAISTSAKYLKPIQSVCIETTFVSLKLNFLSQLFVCSALMFTLCDNFIDTYDFHRKDWNHFFHTTLQLKQGWKMFGKTNNRSVWHVVELQKDDGTIINYLDSGDVNLLQKPADVSQLYPNRYWRKYFSRATSSQLVHLREPLLKYIIKKRNKSVSFENIVEARLYKLKEKSDGIECQLIAVYDNNKY